jgi:hypothetical protein
MSRSNFESSLLAIYQDLASERKAIRRIGSKFVQGRSCSLNLPPKSANSSRKARSTRSMFIPAAARLILSGPPRKLRTPDTPAHRHRPYRSV